MAKQPLTPEMIELLQKFADEVATEVGFGTVTIVIEKGEARRIQKTTDLLLRSRVDRSSQCPVGA